MALPNEFKARLKCSFLYSINDRFGRYENKIKLAPVQQDMKLCSSGTFL